MLLEMHAHTAEHSACSRVAGKDLIRQVFVRGLQGIVLTDHHYLWPQQELRDLRHAAEVPESFVILSGQEVSTSDFGDVLVYGVDTTLPRGSSVRSIRKKYPEAALVWAHPYRDNRIPSDEKLLDPELDGVEIFNSNHTVLGNTRALRDWHRLRFTASAGTDTHARSYAGIYPTFFDHTFTTVEELAREIRRSHCRPFLREISHGGASAEVVEVNLGAKEVGEPLDRIIIKTLRSEEKWKSAARGFVVMDAIAGHGFADGQYRVPRPIDSDPGSMLVIEQALRGKSLYDKVTAAAPAEGKEFVRMAARWLALLHSARLIVTPPDEFMEKELGRLAKYLEHFTMNRSPHTGKFSQLIEAVREEERGVAEREGAYFVQVHGDYHPKNIFIGRDSRDDRASSYTAAIDFESSFVAPPAFDVGYFLAQFRNQLFQRLDILQHYPDSIFLDAYLEKAGSPGADFLRQVELFRARGNVNIASYLINIGQGKSEGMWRVMVEAEQAITLYRAVGR